uniref:Uncharacterized protein n=1 Tax=Parascaris equorum TaxID=6256 RepID=A0A914R9R0_PAREQ
MLLAGFYTTMIGKKLVDIALSGGFLVKQAIELVLRAQKRETPFITVTVGEVSLY